MDNVDIMYRHSVRRVQIPRAAQTVHPGVDPISPELMVSLVLLVLLLLLLEEEEKKEIMTANLWYLI